MNPYFKPRSYSGTSYKVTELRKIYEYPPPSSKPITVGIPSWGGGVYGTITNGILTDGDIQKCWAYEGILPANMPIVKVRFIGGALNDLSDRVYNMTCENALDIISVGSGCPSNLLTIILFIFPNHYSFTQGINVILNSPVTIISCSWGTPESQANMPDMIRANAMLQKATSRGINICVASGDNGADDGTNRLTLDYPSACPYVISLGGTTLTANKGEWKSETVWNSRQGSTGGGISNYFLKQSWQTKQTRPGKFRSSPDVALVADPNTGITIVLNGKLVHNIGGTSVSAPLFAGFLACISPKVNVASLLYSAPLSCYHDIRVGNNDGYNATLGYDNCSGMGSIIGTKLATYILKNSLSISPSTHQSILIGNTITYSTNLQSVQWSSSNPSVATVNQGVVTGIKAGKVTITATQSNSSASTIVTVLPILATHITLSLASSPQLNKPVRLLTTITPSNVTNPEIQFKSNNPNFRIKAGFLMCTKAGTAIISARTTDGSNKMTTLQVTVKYSAKMLFT
jgi:subtilase family serine protease